MVEKWKMQEANTFLNKKGRAYVIYFASLEEKEYFDGILYDKGIPMTAVINQIYFHSLVVMATKKEISNF